MGRSIGIFGCGTIGTEIASAVADETVEASLEALYDRNPGRADAVADLFASTDRPAIVDDPRTLGREADLVVECASQEAVAEWAVPFLETGCDLLMLSVGALADANLRADVIRTAERTETVVHVPSGAIAGIDAIKAAALTGDLESVSLATRKHPKGLLGAPYLEDHHLDLRDVDEATVIFDGPATEAAQAFPSNINVAMVLSLAGIGPEATTVTIVADPEETANVHHIQATGGMGRIETEVHNVPSPSNPKTSYLAAVSAIEALRELDATLRVGT